MALFIVLGKILGGVGLDEGSIDFGLRYVKFEEFNLCLSRDVEEVIGYISLEFREVVKVRD